MSILYISAVPEIKYATDEWTDGWTEKVTYRSGYPPKNKKYRDHS